MHNNLVHYENTPIFDPHTLWNWVLLHMFCTHLVSSYTLFYKFGPIAQIWGHLAQWLALGWTLVAKILCYTIIYLLYINVFFSVHQCPSDETTIRFNEGTQDGFIIDINDVEDDSPLTPGGADIIPSEEVSIKTSSPPGDDFRVMDLTFTVTNPDATSPVTVTITFITAGVEEVIKVVRYFII